MDMGSLLERKEAGDTSLRPSLCPARTRQRHHEAAAGLERIHFSAVNKFSQMFVRMVGRRDVAASEVAGRRRTDGI